MLKPEENEIFVRVGPKTPAGEWLRRFWHPIAISDKWQGIKTLWKCEEKFTFKGRYGTAAEFGDEVGTFKGKPTAIRILGEDLVLYRDGSGLLGLLGIRCPHRGASLEYGRVRENGLACCYHGWCFDSKGACIDMPAEPPDSKFKYRVKHVAYPVQEMGGFIWAYMGPAETPQLPRLDVVARDDGCGLWKTSRCGHAIIFKFWRTRRTLRIPESFTGEPEANAAIFGVERFRNHGGRKISLESLPPRLAQITSVPHIY